MYRFFCCIATSVAFLPLALGQNVTTISVPNGGTVATGFAVVRPVSGFGEGLMLFAKLTDRVGATDFQATIPFGPVVTDTALVVSSDGPANLNTGIAIVNPGNFAVDVSLALRNQQGNIVATTVLTLAPLEQISKFIGQLFNGAGNAAVAGLLSLTSTGPIAVAGLIFHGSEFTFLPTTAAGINIRPTSLLTPQIADGGGWTTDIVIADRLGTIQIVAIDIYNPSGKIIATAPSINLPAGGVAVVSFATSAQ